MIWIEVKIISQKNTIENLPLNKLDFTKLKKVILEGEKDSESEQIALYKTKNNLIIIQYNTIRK